MTGESLASMNAVVAPEPALSSEGTAAPQPAPSPEDANSGAAPDLADQEAQAPANEGVDPGSPTGSDGGRNTAQHRIQELAAEKRAALDAAEFWRTRALSTTPTPTPPEPQADLAPTIEQFEYDTAKWTVAHNAWVERELDRRTTAVVDQRLQKREAEQAQATAKTQWDTRVSEFLKTTPDFTVVMANERLPITPTMTEVIVSSEKGPAIAYHLGLNPDKAARIARLPATQQAAAMGRLEAELTAPPAPVKKPTPRPTNAPAPPTPVGSNAPSKPIESMTIAEYMEDRATRRKLTRA